MRTWTSPLLASLSVYGTSSISCWTVGSLNFRPINRLMEKMVFSGLEMATTDGVKRFPSALGMTVGSPPSITAITELVVPRSIPRIFAI